MRKLRKTKKHCRRNKRHSHRRHGGNLEQSLSQGQQFLNFHEGQHGGCGLHPAPLSSITDSALPSDMVGAAGLNGLHQAFGDIKGMSDQTGGKRHRHGKKYCNKSHKRGKKVKGGRRHRSKHRKHRGGMMEYAPFPSKGMLLNSTEYAQAGLNPQWSTDVAFDMAQNRSSF